MNQLTEEEKRVKIAEECGWLRMNRMGREVYYDPTGGHVMPHDLPDYFHDLNACAEMEKVMTVDQLWRMDFELAKLCGVSGGHGSGNHSEWTWHANATQRAEAFGRVKGLWQ